MRRILRTHKWVLIWCTFLASAIAASNEDFSGEWRLDRARSVVRNLPVPVDAFLRVQAKGNSLVISGAADPAGPFTTHTYPLDGAESKTRNEGSTRSTLTKWEGAALLVNTIVSGPQSYTVMERWKKSRDGRRLTIARTIIRLGEESESVLVYDNPNAAPAADVAEAAPQLERRPESKAEREPAEYVVEAGTKVLLALINPVNTKVAKPGDRVYLETRYPVSSKGRVIVPPGSQVTATVTDSQRAGRVKGKASLYLRFDTLILPNGVTRSFRARADSVENAEFDRKEGRMTGPGSKGKDTRTVAETTGAGATVGTLAGGGTGAGIGAALGAAAGLAGVLGSRGQDLILPKGTTMEMILDRDLKFSASEL
jgi:type IV secretion system protein VirB10